MPSSQGPNPTSAKKLFIKNYGCQMNVYDAERMTDILEGEGYETVADPADADLVLLNTCHIREKAAEKVYSDLGRLKSIKADRGRNGHDTLIGVAGCVAQAEAGEIIARQPAVDLVFGPQTYQNLPELLRRAKTEKVLETEFPIEDKFEKLSAIKRKHSLTAFVTVQEGCDKFCTFCVVPYTRGAETSRPPQQIIDEVAALVDQGVREITLLGQNVNAYNAPSAGNTGAIWRLGDLIADISAIDGLQRIRYTTSHPRDMSQDLLDQHRDNPKLMPYLHLPLQAGSDNILKAMNRQHTAEDYLRIIENVRAARPDIALSSDFIVGFPGESDQDFARTLDVIRTVEYAQAFSFKYSPRPGTPGADMDGQISEQEKSDRLHDLQALLAVQQKNFNENCVGKHMDILIEKPGRHPGQLAGRSPYLQPVHVSDVSQAGLPEGTAAIGRMVTVKVTAAQTNSLAGLIPSEASSVSANPSVQAQGSVRPVGSRPDAQPVGST